MLKSTSSKIIVALVIFVFFIGGYFALAKEPAEVNSSENKVLATVYKSPTCGCCVGYTGFLKKDGYEVLTKDTKDMDSVKQTHNIPTSMQSCHTTEIEEYFFEGHIPLEVVDKLLAEKPDLDGIALPGMPAGSPGMPGVKSEEFIIYGLKDGNVSEYMRI